MVVNQQGENILQFSVPLILLQYSMFTMQKLDFPQI